MHVVEGKYETSNDTFLDQLADRYRNAANLMLKHSMTEEYDIIESDPASFDDYLAVHTEDYVDKIKRVYRSGVAEDWIEKKSVVFEQVGIGGTLLATDTALRDKTFAYHLGGGYHHAMAERVNSIDYCNDVALSIKRGLTNGLEKILYIDLDAHHPDGVQSIFKEEPNILQISMHQWDDHSNQGHYSYIGDDKTLGKRINMPIPLHTGDGAYLKILDYLLTNVLKTYDPDMVVYQAGVDVYRNDPIGKLNLSLSGIYNRDLMVAKLCRKPSIPFVAVLGGGYNPEDTPKAIVNTLAAFANKPIVYEDDEIKGITDKKAYRWCRQLARNLSDYIHFEQDPF